MQEKCMRLCMVNIIKIDINLIKLFNFEMYTIGISIEEKVM